MLAKRWLKPSWRCFGQKLNHSFINPINIQLNSLKLYSSKPVLLQDVTKKVESFGKVKVNLPFDVEIKPADPHEYPDMDTLMVKLFSKGSEIGRKDLVSVKVAKECDISLSEPGNQLQDLKCLIEVPVTYDVEAKVLGDGEVKIADMVSGDISIETEFGDIKGSKLQGKKIVLSSSEGGSVILDKSILGAIEVNTAKDGVVKADKCLGTQLDVSTENGDVNIGSNYCEKSTFSTVNGNLKLNNLHKDSQVDINGNGTLDTCLDGSLQANLQEGSAKIQLVRVTGDSQIQSSGDVHLIIPENIDSKLILKAKVLNIDDKIAGKLLDDGKQFENDANGFEFKVETDKKLVAIQSNWMESLKLEKHSKKH